jgi:hypothetical protein
MSLARMSTRRTSAALPEPAMICSIMAVMVSDLPVPLSAEKTRVFRSPFLKVIVNIAPWTGIPPIALTSSLWMVSRDFFRNPT